MHKTCHICLSSFVPHKQTGGIQIYCSVDCGKVGKSLLKRPYVPKPESPRICRVCSKTFMTKRSTKNICSSLCSGNENRRKNKMGGNWGKAMERDGKKCRLCPCDDITRLIVHHIDGTGERDSPNHNLDNLAVLCKSCHCKVHQLSFKVVNGVIALDNPMYKLTGVLPLVFLDMVITPTLVNQ